MKIFEVQTWTSKRNILVIKLTITQTAGKINGRQLPEKASNFQICQQFHTWFDQMFRFLNTYQRGRETQSLQSEINSRI